ncbi:MAG: galactose ABC transporter substrate-binding protein, partial [Pseudoflavonifractor sp.]
LAACGAPAAKPTTAPTAAPGASTAPAPTASDLNVGVFYYTFSDVYISSVRSLMDEKLEAAGVKFMNYDGNNMQSTQIDQINTAISDGANLLIVNIVETSSPDAAQGAVDAAKAAGIPIIFFNREVADEVVNSYENCAFVGTDAPEAGHMQGKMVGKYLVDNYDAVDLNKDGVISYVMFKGQEGNAEAEFRTQFGVEDADKILTEGGKKALSFYDAGNTSKYLVDQTGGWSAQASTDYMNTILGEYNAKNNNMVELVIANNDGMAEGAVSALQAVGYNKGDDPAMTIPVFGVDATDSAKALIDEGKMTGTVKQDADGMAATITALVANIKDGAKLMDNTDSFVVDEAVAKVRVPYGVYDGK